MKIATLFILSLMLTGLLVSAEDPVKKESSTVRKFLESLKNKIHGTGKAVVEVGKGVAEKGKNAVIKGIKKTPLAFLIAPRAVQQIVKTLFTDPKLFAKKVVSAPVSVLKTLRTTLDDLRRDLESVKKDGLESNEEYKSLLIQEIAKAKAHVDEIIERAKNAYREGSKEQSTEVKEEGGSAEETQEEVDAKSSEEEQQEEGKPEEQGEKKQEEQKEQKEEKVEEKQEEQKEQKPRKNRKGKN